MKYLAFSIIVILVPAFAAAETLSVKRPQARAQIETQPQVVSTVVDAKPDVQAATPEPAETPQPEEQAASAEPAQTPEPAATAVPFATNGFQTDLRPPARSGVIPRTRWQHMEGNVIWTRAALSALKSHGAPLVNMVPRDIADWCPAYPTNSDADRRAFWVGFMSALAKHESTYKPWAVGGGGQWYGLLQILPQTARWRKCSVGTGEALKNGAANLSCAVRIMAITVPRDGVIHGYRGKRGLGITADWGPMHKAAKRRDMAGWLKRQTYCVPTDAIRPKERPDTQAG